MKPIFIFLFTTLSLVSFGQNLVPNPSFEDTIGGCHINPSAFYFGKVDKWFQPTDGTPDLFNPCANGYYPGVPLNTMGYSFPKTGDSYSGMFTYEFNSPAFEVREYIAVRLKDSLQSGTKYYARFSISRADSSNYATKIGLHLNSDSLYLPIWGHLTNIPQIEESQAIVQKGTWVDVFDSFIAQGGEKYLYLGNFNDDLNSDTVNTYDGGWINMNSYNGAFYYIDDVCVSQDSLTCYNFSVGVKEQEEKAGVNIYPNPTSGNFTIELEKQDKATITIYNIAGKRIFNKHYTSNELIEINLDAPSGLYFVKAETDKGVFTEKILKQ